MGSHDGSEAGYKLREMPGERLIVGIKNRLLQMLARSLPGAFTFRVWAHRMRGVAMGKRVHVATDVLKPLTPNGCRLAIMFSSGHGA
jgi:hypothetical protein